ncbi:MAG: hypothetical protein A2139_01780 [Desulfobacca sp. RBG_16_60_12]|nr:MAG: hypothetical protein A2139_01780 [Desulfobacca sp. RBG_16_60_12]
MLSRVKRAGKDRSMQDKVIVEVLAAHADHLAANRGAGEDYLNLFPAYRAELAPLLRIAEQVKAALAPVSASPEFQSGLKRDLLAAALQRAEKQRNKRRTSFLLRREVLIGAALGSAISLAGIIAALLWRQRSVARV